MSRGLGDVYKRQVEGMLDVFLGRRGKTLYTDADNCARTYISIKKQIDAIKKLREEA